MKKNEMIAKLVDYYADGNKSKFAYKIGVKPQTINSWLIRNSFDVELIYSKCEKVSAHWLLTGEGSMLEEVDKPVQQSNGLPLIPIDAVAGFPTADNDGVALADCQRYVVPEFNTKGANFLIRVSGDSMMPMFHNGDIIACRKISDVLFFQWGEVYVLDTSQGVLVKRVRECQADETCITCESENERYDSFRLPKSDVRSLSTIVGLIRMM